MSKKNFKNLIKDRNPFLNQSPAKNNIEKLKEDGEINKPKKIQEEVFKKEEKVKKLKAGRPLGVKNKLEKGIKTNLIIPNKNYEKIKNKVIKTPQLTLTSVINEAINDYIIKHKL